MSAIDNYKKQKGKRNKYDSDKDILDKWAEEHKKFVKHALMSLYSETQREKEKQKIYEEVMQDVRNKEDVIAKELGDKIKRELDLK